MGTQVFISQMFADVSGLISHAGRLISQQEANVLLLHCRNDGFSKVGSSLCEAEIRLDHHPR